MPERPIAVGPQQATSKQTLYRDEFEAGCSGAGNLEEWWSTTNHCLPTLRQVKLYRAGQLPEQPCTT